MSNSEIPNILSITAEPRTYLDITILDVDSVTTKTSVTVGDIIAYKAIAEGKKLQGVARVSGISTSVLTLDASEQFMSNKFQLNVQDLREIKLHSEGEEV